MEQPIKKNKFSNFARSLLRLRPQEIWERDYTRAFVPLDKGNEEGSGNEIVKTSELEPQAYFASHYLFFLFLFCSFLIF